MNLFLMLAQTTTQSDPQDMLSLLKSAAGIGIVTGFVLKAIKEWLPANRLPLQVWSMVIAVILTLTSRYILGFTDTAIAPLIVGAILNSLTGMGTFALIDAPKDSPKVLNDLNK